MAFPSKIKFHTKQDEHVVWRSRPAPRRNPSTKLGLGSCKSRQHSNAYICNFYTVRFGVVFIFYLCRNHQESSSGILLPYLGQERWGKETIKRGGRVFPTSTSATASIWYQISLKIIRCSKACLSRLSCVSVCWTFLCAWLQATPRCGMFLSWVLWSRSRSWNPSVWV